VNDVPLYFTLCVCSRVCGPHVLSWGLQCRRVFPFYSPSSPPFSAIVMGADKRTPFIVLCVISIVTVVRLSTCLVLGLEWPYPLADLEGVKRRTFFRHRQAWQRGLVVVVVFSAVLLLSALAADAYIRDADLIEGAFGRRRDLDTSRGKSGAFPLVALAACRKQSVTRCRPHRTSHSSRCWLRCWCLSRQW